MFSLDIPGRFTLQITDIVFDFNGTLAIDGELITGVIEKINALSELVNFHVITADTYGTVAQKLAGVSCTIVNLSKDPRFKDKLAYIEHLGKEQCLAAGNGFNDREMLQHAGLGVALMQAEGVYVPTLMAADIACQSIMDVFAFLEKPARLKATLRV